MKHKLNLLLAHIDMTQGTPFSRFNKPDYEPNDQDIEEAAGRIDSLINFNAMLSIAIRRLEREADWLAGRLSEFCDPDHDRQCCALNRTHCNGVDACAWREAAKAIKND